MLNCIIVNSRQTKHIKSCEEIFLLPFRPASLSPFGHFNDAMSAGGHAEPSDNRAELSGNRAEPSDSHAKVSDSRAEPSYTDPMSGGGCT